ncbi:DUF3037 domain-containing protein [Granulicella aggregans]|uniref:DUF3037 domain-containing protein n=1 Tax=Granulicella aggregans TaxID=474949 RepID=UPI0021E029EA|nr:DUF3037 domain-containing protein [Granulicella aggregans]
MPTPPSIPCEFFLIRYVPDVVKGEFTNIGVLLRDSSNPGLPPRLRFTRDWTRVRCMHLDADTDLLEALEAEMLHRLQTDTSDPATYPKPILTALTDSLSNSIQISEPRACIAENLTVELEQLMRLYVEPLRVTQSRRRSGRATIVAAMRSEFERSGVWAQMRKRIPAAQYTRPGDPMRLDCGYRAGRKTGEGPGAGVIRIFHAVSLDSDVEAAKSLAFSAPLLLEGVRRVDSATLDLTAVVEPIRTLSPETGTEEDFTGEAADLYRFGVSTMESAGIRVLTLNNLAAAAQTARIELRL